MEKLKVLDIFSGIAGFSYGLEKTGGFSTIAFCEIDLFCQKVLKKHYPGVPIYDDITKLDGKQFNGKVQVICGGFPCTNISDLGNREGLEGEQSGLWREYARIISEVRPEYIIVENVAAMLYRGLGEVLADLAALGYDAEWHCIPASSVGAPHERDRLWIIAHTVCQSERPLWKRRLRKIEKNTWPGFLLPVGMRVDDGLPNWLDRNKSLGNAIVPRIATLIGNAILEDLR